MNLCGSQEVCRQVRDLHLLDVHMSKVLTTCKQAGLDVNSSSAEISINLNYDLIISLVCSNITAALYITTVFALNITIALHCTAASHIIIA